MIFETVQGYIEEMYELDSETWDARHEDKLAVSDIGHCPRKALLRVEGVEYTDPHDAYLKRLFWSGKMAERKLEVALEHFYGDLLRKQVKVGNDNWVGSVDFLVPDMVIEHKETAESNFKYKRLPYDFHVLQVLMYRHMLLEAGESYPLNAYLYYQNRANWAEYKVESYPGGVKWDGQINGEESCGSSPRQLAKEMRVLEKPLNNRSTPPRYEHPFKKQFACCRLYTYVAYPGCTYFTHCWGDEYDGSDKIAIPEEYR